MWVTLWLKENFITCLWWEPISVIKEDLDKLLDAIVNICILSLQTGVFPQKLMIAVIVAMFKSGDSQILENYRPISILVALSKISEKMWFKKE